MCMWDIATGYVADSLGWGKGWGGGMEGARGGVGGWRVHLDLTVFYDKGGRDSNK